LANTVKLELSPTPHANCNTGAGTQGRDGGMNLQTAVQLSPPTTPRVKLSATPRHEGFDAGGHRGNPDSLPAVVKLSATGASKTSGDGIATQAKLSATPSARDWKNGQASQSTVEKNSHPLNEQVIRDMPSEDSGTENRRSSTGTLSPMFVEEYMGFPVGWTELKEDESKTAAKDSKRSGTPFVPSTRTRSSRRSRKSKED